MRKAFALFSLSLIVCDCSGEVGQPRLEPLARGLSEAMRPAYADFTLEIRALDKGDRVILHCVLRNTSIAESAIDVDESTLPWRNADIFDINAVAVNGKVVHRNPPPVVARISGMPKLLTVASGQSIEGEMDLGAMPISGVPRNEDLLLLWSSSIRKFSGDNDWVVLRGVTFLRAAK